MQVSCIARSAAVSCLHDDRKCAESVQTCSCVKADACAAQLTMERWPPCQQLKQNCADTPQVRLGVILVEVEDFRSHVQR